MLPILVLWARQIPGRLLSHVFSFLFIYRLKGIQFKHWYALHYLFISMFFFVFLYRAKGSEFMLCYTKSISIGPKRIVDRLTAQFWPVPADIACWPRLRVY